MHKLQQQIRDAIVNAWRTPRTTPREGIPSNTPRAWEDPAPDWVWQTVDAILARTRSETDQGAGIVHRAIAWCTAGDAELRAAKLRALIGLWIGDRVPMLHAFLASAEDTGGGVTSRALPTVRGEVLQFTDRGALVLVDGEDTPRTLPAEQVRPLIGPRPVRVRDRVRVCPHG